MPFRTAYKITSARLCKIEFVLQVPAVRFHRVKAEVKLRRNIFIRFAPCQHLQDFSLPGGEQLIAIFGSTFFHLPHVIFHQDLADFGAEKCLAFTHRLDCLNEVIFRGVLQNIPLGSRLERPQDVPLVRVHAQDHNPQRVEAKH